MTTTTKNNAQINTPTKRLRGAKLAAEHRLTEEIAASGWEIHLKYGREYDQYQSAFLEYAREGRMDGIYFIITRLKLLRRRNKLTKQIAKLDDAIVWNRPAQ